MLVVMGVIIILLGLATPVMKGILAGNPVGNGVDVITSFMTNARMQAMTQNTYVVVGFSQAANSDDLQLAAVRSLNGTFDPNTVYSGTNPYSGLPITYRPLGPVIHLSNVTLQTFPSLTKAMQTKVNIACGQTSGNSGAATQGFMDCSARPAQYATPSTMAFQYGSTIFNWCLLAFSPQGEALYFPNATSTSGLSVAAGVNTPFYNRLFLGVNTSRGGVATPDDNSAAAIIIDGGAGNIRSYRL